ncbi:MAG: P-loop NTPase, partial [Dehalococcoidales bacterium]|nr:P-loop NTPase [Dehalococcoidales bacterium]
FALPGTGRYQLVRQMLANVQFSELDFLLLDLPPNSGDETLSLWEHLRDLWGLVLVCQPTNLAVQDIERTLNMIEVKQLPLLGMVGNMVVAIAPKSGEVFSPFLDAGVDLEGFCQRRGIPYLASIPFTPDPEIHRKVFQELADKVLAQEPVKIWQRSFTQRLQDATLKGLVKGIFSKDD